MATEAGHGFLPQQVQIDAYGNGGFRFAGMSHKGSLLCLPSGMRAWPVTSSAGLTIEDFAPVLAVAGEIDVLMIGLGHGPTELPPALRRALREAGLIVEAITTGSAVRTYNVLMNEERAVGAALIAVESAK